MYVFFFYLILRYYQPFYRVQSACFQNPSMECYIYTYTYIFIHIFIYIFICTHTYLYIYMYICICILFVWFYDIINPFTGLSRPVFNTLLWNARYTYIYIYIYIYTYTYVYIYIHIYTLIFVYIYVYKYIYILFVSDFTILLTLLQGSVGLFSKPFYGMLRTCSNSLNNLSYKMVPRIEGEQKHLLRRMKPPTYFHTGLLSFILL
jgi:hypothetical protein